MFNCKFLILFIGLLCNGIHVGFSQNNSSHKEITVDEYISNYKLLIESYSNYKSISFQMHYSTFDSILNSEKKDESFGFYRKDIDLIHNYELGVHTFQDSIHRLIIDSVNKKITMAFPIKSISSSFSIIDEGVLRKYVNKVELYDLGNTIKYSLHFIKDAPWVGYSIEIEKNNNLTREIIIYLKEKQTEGWGEKITEKIYYPVIKIDFLNYNLKFKMNSNEVKIENWLKRVNNLKDKFTLKDTNQSYNFNDLRVIR